MTLDTLPSRLFVTGTDTEVGKTYCTTLLVKHLMAQGKTVFPFKPVSAGVESHLLVDDKPVNLDAYELWQATAKRYVISAINPIVFQQAIAPHIAANNEGRTLGYTELDEVYTQIPESDMCVIEGAGGWLLPLNETELMSDWVAQKGLPVVLVVGIKLGCLNHALLTALAIRQSGCQMIGWIANFLEGETETARQNAQYLSQQFSRLYQAPCLFEVQRGQTQL